MAYEAQQGFRTVNGEGRPRIIIRKAASSWTSGTGTTYTSTTVREAKGSTVNISSSNASEDSVTFATNHGLLLGERFEIAGHTSTPDINGERSVIAVSSPTKVVIDLNITSGGGATGTGRKVPDYRRVSAGMRVTGIVVRGGGLPTLPVYGRITIVTSNISDAYKQLTVAEWVGGTPTDAQVYNVNGYVVDLPYCQKLTETFTAEQLVHPLWRKRLASEFVGWNYGAMLDYSQHIKADTIINLRAMLRMTNTDEIVLVPRVDQPQFQYPVIYDTPIAMSLFGKAGGHSKIIFGFKGKYLMPFPIVTTGYGYNYAKLYGTGL